MFVLRTEGKVVSGFNLSQFEGQEQVADDAPEVVAFLQALNDPVPSQVSSGQLIQALSNLGKLAAVDAAVTQADPLSKRLWDRASLYPRSDPRVIAIATAVGMSSEDLDNLFRLAASL